MNWILIQFLWFALGLCLGAMIVVGVFILDFDNLCDADYYPTEEDIEAMKEDFERVVNNGIEEDISCGRCFTCRLENS